MIRLIFARPRAFWLGLREAFRDDGSFGRTNPHDLDWNEAYDLGGNIGDALALAFKRSK